MAQWFLNYYQEIESNKLTHGHETISAIFCSPMVKLIRLGVSGGSCRHCLRNGQVTGSGMIFMSSMVIHLIDGESFFCTIEMKSSNTMFLFRL